MGYSEAAKAGLGRPPPNVEKPVPTEAGQFVARGTREFTQVRGEEGEVVLVCQEKPAKTQRNPPKPTSPPEPI